MSRLLLALLLTTPAFCQIQAPNELGVSMGYLHLLSADPSLHRPFWVDLLGGKQVRLGDWQSFKFPGVIVSVQKGKPSAGSEGSSVNHLGFLVNDLEAYVTSAKAKGFRVAEQRPSPSQAFLFAPDGIKVELTEDRSVKGGAVHHHVHFFTESDVEARDWYVRTLGGVSMRRGRFEAADIPGANLSFSRAEQPVSPTKGRAVDHIGFEVKRLKSFVSRLETQGVKFDVPYSTSSSGPAVAFFTDPWGTRVALTEGLDRL